MNAVVNIPSWLSDQAATTEQEWFANIRQHYLQTFLEVGMPTRRNERWKYADTTFLSTKQFISASRQISVKAKEAVAKLQLPSNEAISLVCINGWFIPELSNLDQLPKEVILCDLQTALTQHSAVFKAAIQNKFDAKKYPFAALNMAMCIDGIFLYQPKNCKINTPVQLLSITDESNFITHPLHCMIIQDEMTLIEEYQAVDADEYFTNTTILISLDENAQFKHNKIQQESITATHIAHTIVEQQRDSLYVLTNVSTGARFSRDEISINLIGAGANCSTGGFYYLKNDGQYIDHHIDIMHSAAHTNSEMLYKGIIDKKARAVFNGRLLVNEGSQKIIAYQANHNLLLSNTAEVYSKPELEIYADDVKCKHGATTGQINQDALFYLRARGIDYQTALSILLEGFAEDIIKRFAQTTLRTRLREIL